MSFPMSDITAAYRNAPERTDEVWQKVSPDRHRALPVSAYPKECCRNLSCITSLCFSCPLSLLQIQWCLLRNNHSQKFPQDQAFRLHQGIVTNSAEQVNVPISLYNPFCCTFPSLMPWCHMGPLQSEVKTGRRMVQDLPAQGRTVGNLELGLARGAGVNGSVSFLSPDDESLVREGPGRSTSPP